MIVVGVDPGKDGGVAVMRSTADGATALLAVRKMPETDVDKLDLFRSVAGRWGRDRCYLERAHPMPKQGLTSTFKFGEGYGFVRSSILAAGFSLVIVRAQDWQASVLGAKKRPKEEKPAHKRRLRGIAQQMFPDVRVTLSTADALLIASFGVSREVGSCTA